ncbi:MAG: 1-deoxy-D-xylulose-5-phosphate reductoisomerase [Planctomycetes bacterium]|nr:1-deoxy-D-xylulose-5-phosphate reductoisomerase [Planctomycetota bacterium]MCB9910429.1 1-deoxy-D-xylulose-5-phosphate reductoisomerase [Planctomycetota bacterium]MCB9912555.1 1-deoxy-D-xylulose-5-phosphate reductoisomerase [Planctomycetota bacterium]HPF14601.1 1-deoxy-D-xylulose-5-phosphate reductoisomerase [Planctomycetota bacterium]
MAQLPILLLGSTGSIGTQTLALVREHRERVSVVGLSAHGSAEELLAQALEFRPPFVALCDPEAASRIEDRLPAGTTLFTGPEANLELVQAAPFRVAMHGIVGAQGLRPSMAVLEKGGRLALANKESLVLGGAMLLDVAQRHGSEILPVDSEHSAVYQCLRGESLARVRRVLLTASGGPFRGLSQADLEGVTPPMALRHPTWEMGPRITVGSATLMNKAFEIIELHHLFGLEPERIDVVVHPQSVVHSMVEFVDGSVIAQMGPPDMRGPILFALFAPDREPAPQLRGFDLETFSRLTFEAPDHGNFPALAMAYDCIRQGGTSGAVLNAADEVAVEAFLAGQIAFPDMGRLCRAALDQRPTGSCDVEGLLAADRWARSFTKHSISDQATTTLAPPRKP